MEGGREEEQTGTARWESDDEQGGGPGVGDGGVPGEWGSGAWDRLGDGRVGVVVTEIGVSSGGSSCAGW